ncbi:MAG: sugar transferase [Candidatus Latescibacteria bacterium]|nr:sugar transferase [bacterium]MBD3424357.1 sugar transferase [Candidatus Latescibacterota bacterium]
MEGKMAGCPNIKQAELKSNVGIKGSESMEQISGGVRQASPYLCCKRTIDLVVASFIVLLVLPLIPVIVLLIKMDSRGPVLFRQKRVGKDGRVFDLYKFRSMVDGAEKALDSLRPLSNTEGPIFKIEEDPRITRVGRFLRRSSLDELPQIINVLKGDMSIVGPRPNLPSEVAQYLPWQRTRLLVTPGITCFWQVAGRSHIGFQEWMRLDLEYIKKRSIKTDLKIIFKTFPAVIARKGAF